MKTNSRYHSSSWSTTQWIIFILALILLLFLTVGLKGQTVPPTLKATPTSEETPTEGTQYDRNFIDKLGKEYVSLKPNNALVIGIFFRRNSFEKNGQKQVFTYGETKKGNGIKPNENAIFEIGQMSEVFTTSLLALLEMEGKVSSVEPVQDVLKGVLKVPYYQRMVCQAAPIKQPVAPEDMRPPLTICFPDTKDMPQMMVLCDLATHSSGLPEAPYAGLFVGKNAYKDYTFDKLKKYISNLPPNEAFGFQYNHSMVGTALLGQALAVRMKKSYAAILKEQILDPLSMEHTFVSPNAEQAKLFINGHTAKGVYTPHRDYNALTPAAGIRSSVPDLLTFLEANLYNLSIPKAFGTEKEAPSDKNKFNIALAETHTPRIYTDARNSEYLMGWGWIQSPLEERDSKNNPIRMDSYGHGLKGTKKMYTQGGERGGFAVFMGFVKESGTAVVVLSNTANSVQDMGHEILKSLQSEWTPTAKAPEKIKTASVQPIKN